LISPPFPLSLLFSRIDFVAHEKQVLQEQLDESKNETAELNKLYEEMLGELMAANDKFRQEQQITEELNGIVAALEEEKTSLRNKLVEEEEKMRMVAVAMEELAV
jgi:predicted  nucleic acid-binding Zn-ribbon protein